MGLSKKQQGSNSKEFVVHSIDEMRSKFWIECRMPFERNAIQAEVMIGEEKERKKESDKQVET